MVWTLSSRKNLTTGSPYQTRKLMVRNTITKASKIDFDNRKKSNRCLRKVLKKFSACHWPGNIRELEHLVERNILLAEGTIIEDINLPVFSQMEIPVAVSETRIKTIEVSERDHMLAVLKKCNGRIWGAGTAAEILNIPSFTLKSKMKKKV